MSLKESFLEKEELLSDIFMNLIIYQLEKDFTEDKNEKNKFVEDLIKLKEKLQELKIKL